jgi:hypothetical protein
MAGLSSLKLDAWDKGIETQSAIHVNERPLIAELWPH